MRSHLQAAGVRDRYLCRTILAHYTRHGSAVVLNAENTTDCKMLAAVMEC